MPADHSGQLVLLNHLAEEFAARYRRGERPRVQDYIDKHPELAADIRELFPAMVEMEVVKEERREISEPTSFGPLPALERLGTSASSARSAMAVWESCMRPSKSRWAGTLRATCGPNSR